MHLAQILYCVLPTIIKLTEETMTEELPVNVKKSKPISKLGRRALEKLHIQLQDENMAMANLIETINNKNVELQKKIEDLTKQVNINFTQYEEYRMRFENLNRVAHFAVGQLDEIHSDGRLPLYKSVNTGIDAECAYVGARDTCRAESTRPVIEKHHVPADEYIGRYRGIAKTLKDAIINVIDFNTPRTEKYSKAINSLYGNG